MKPLITITIVEEATYARRVAQLACRQKQTEILTHDAGLAGRIAGVFAEIGGAEVRIVSETPAKP